MEHCREFLITFQNSSGEAIKGSKQPLLNPHILINGHDFTSLGALFLAYADLVCSELSSRGVSDSSGRGPHSFPIPGCIRLSESPVRNSKEVILASALHNVHY